MSKLMVLMVSVVMTGSAFSGVTTHFALDTRSGMRLATAGSTLAVDYSPDFSTIQDVTDVRVLTNGAVWVESAVVGTKDFTFGDAGIYQFSHQVLAYGGVVDEMSAVYAVSDSGWFEVTFDHNGGAGTSIPPIWMEIGRVYKLPKCTLKPPVYKPRFVGWAGSNGRRYDDEMLVFNIAKPGETVTMTAIWDGEKEYVGVQLWENGPFWAECNVGASQPEESGYYFWWGDTVGYKRNASNDGWISVKDSTSFLFSSGNCPTYGKNNSQLQSEGYIDATGNLVAAHDAATAHLGAPWRMPTDAEFAALISNCTTTWTTRNGVTGRLVTGKGDYASKSIFLPAVGNGYDSRLGDLGSYGLYWSSPPLSDDSNYAWGVDFNSRGFSRDDGCRRYGQSVRPVRGFAK